MPNTVRGRRPEEDVQRGSQMRDVMNVTDISLQTIQEGGDAEIQR